MQRFTVDGSVWYKYLRLLRVERSQLKRVAWRAFLVAAFIAMVPGIESFIHGFFDGLAEYS